MERKIIRDTRLLLELYMQCFKQFEGDEEMKENHEFLLMWVAYAKLYGTIHPVDEVRKTFRDLVSPAGVGHLKAVVYCAWAGFEARQGNWTQFKEVLQSGIDCAAEPVHQLIQCRKRLLPPDETLEGFDGLRGDDTTAVTAGAGAANKENVRGGGGGDSDGATTTAATGGAASLEAAAAAAAAQLHSALGHGGAATPCAAAAAPRRTMFGARFHLGGGAKRITPGMQTSPSVNAAASHGKTGEASAAATRGTTTTTTASSSSSLSTSSRGTTSTRHGLQPPSSVRRPATGDADLREQAQPQPPSYQQQLLQYNAHPQPQQQQQPQQPPQASFHDGARRPLNEYRGAYTPARTAERMAAMKVVSSGSGSGSGGGGGGPQAPAAAVDKENANAAAVHTNAPSQQQQQAPPPYGADDIHSRQALARSAPTTMNGAATPAAAAAAPVNDENAPPPRQPQPSRPGSQGDAPPPLQAQPHPPQQPQRQQQPPQPQPQQQPPQPPSHSHGGDSKPRDTAVGGGGSNAFKIVREWAGDDIFVVNKRPYVKLEQVGRGGSSKVYKVMDSKLRLWALKRVTLANADKSTIATYLNEINILQRLGKHKNVIKLVEAQFNKKRGEIDMVLELGEIDLAKLLHAQQGRPLSENYIRIYWEQMLQAVQTIHDERIVHGDLKPANFVSVQGALKIIDFGIAKTIQNDTTNIMRDNQIGTINYISPEALTDVSDAGDPAKPCMKLSRASDIWSLGCILFTMVYKHPPFHNLNILKKLKYIPDPSYAIVYPPTDIAFAKEVLRSCLQRDASLRPTIPDLLEHPFLRPSKAFRLNV